MKKVFFVALAVVLLASLAVLPASAQSGTGGYAAIQKAAADYFTSSKSPSISAADLYANLNDGDVANDPYLVDVRAAADFANGHIAGAHNVQVKDLFTAAELAKLPKDKQVVVNCYSGQNSAQVVGGLNMLGYNAASLLYGIPSWGTNDKVKYGFTAEQSGNYKVSTEAATLTGTGSLPKTTADSVAAAATAFFTKGTKFIKAADLFANLNDGDATNDPVILDLRSAADYALGHIPGAVNMTSKTLFTTDALTKLPADKQIVAVCYSGQSAGHMTAALNLLGYNAAALQYGMASWAVVKDVSVPVWSNTKTAGYKLVVDAAQPAAQAATPTATAAAAAATPAPAATGAAPTALPTTVGALAIFPLLLAGLGLIGAGLAARRRAA